MNRLKLDFALNTTEERTEFLNKYLQSDTFKREPPSAEELEMMGNYILWGKDPITGKSATQTKDIQIETRNKTWDAEQPESLEALLESPGFNDASIRKITAPRYKVVRETFDRKDALRRCPPGMRETFLSLFREIDSLDLEIMFYDLAHNRRKNPPPDKLLHQFSAAEQEKMREKTTHWNQYSYLKRRHLLVELRRQQFLLRDCFTERLFCKTEEKFAPEALPPDFESEIPILPLGICCDKYSFLFAPFGELHPRALTAEQQELAIRLYWQKAENKEKQFFDFRNPDHIYALFDQLLELRDEEQVARFDSNTCALLKTLEYYVSNTDLTEIHKEILNLKIKKTRNQDIAAYINKKYGKAYTVNYISTIFKQKIIPRIVTTADLHARIAANLCFPEEFKKCSMCGRTLLRDPDNFVRKTRARDGFSSQCKCCDKLQRKRKKEASK